MSAVRWDFLWQRHQALAVAAAEAGWEVDFLEPPVRGVEHALSAVSTRLRGSAPAGVPNPVPAHIRVVRPPKAFAFKPASYKRAYLDRTFPQPYDACILYLPTAALVSFAEKAGGLCVYDNVVDWRTAPATWFPPSDFEEAERRMSGARWARMTDSHAVAARHWNEHRQCLLLPPAADTDFDKHQWQAPKAGQPLVYFGTVRATEIDVPLICGLASSGLPVRVVGPIDDPGCAAELRAAGVRCDPPVLPEALPEIIDSSSALLLPYASARAKTLVPAKLWNCMATNRPLLQRGLNLTPDLARHFTPLPDDDAAAVARAAEIVRAPSARMPVREGWPTRWEQVETALFGSLS